MLEIITIWTGLLLWPANLYFANTPENFFKYSIPVALILAGFLMKRRGSKYYPLPILAVGIFETKLAIFPIFFLLLELISKYRKEILVYLGCAIIIFSFSYRSFIGQTVFVKDYEKQQLIIRNIHLYPNIYLARIFQNKANIILGKIYFNFFALTDPNNYFFAFQPAPIEVHGQNLHKFPFLGIIFFFYGLYFVKKNPDLDFIWKTGVSSVLALTLLSNFDRQDFILWIPISLIIFDGVRQIGSRHKKISVVVYLIFILFSIPEVIRIFIK